AINVARPFGLKIWKGALYKKHRSIQAITENAIHQDPNEDSDSASSQYIELGNILWLFFFGWWLAGVYGTLALVMLSVAFFGWCGLLLNFGWYLFWPFGKFIVKRRIPTRRFLSVLPNFQSAISADTVLEPTSWNDEDSDEEVESESGADGERMDAVDDEETETPRRPMLRESPLPITRQLLEQSAKLWWMRTKEMGPAGLLFRGLTLFVLAPVHLVVSVLCFLGIFSLPMSRLSFAVLQRLLKRRPQGGARQSSSSSGGKKEFRIILCTNHAVGLRYYKYTFDGINIILINLNAVVVFTLFDFYYLGPLLDNRGIGSHEIIFCAALLSVIPLAYLIGMAVSSITAQTGSLALGSVVNATFGSIVEIILYSLALMEGKTRMVEGSIIGSFMAGCLALPGVSMFFGGLNRKEQRFNAKAAGVTSTLLIMAILGVFGPTFFQGVYGTFELHCAECPVKVGLVKDAIACRQCRYRNPRPTEDPIYMSHTRPLMFICATVLILMYAIGLLFTLHTHSKNIYPTEPKKRETEGAGHLGGGHDSPNWGAWKSATVLLLATLFFSVIAEVLIDSVDHVIDSGSPTATGVVATTGKWVIDEKILGLTLFAIVPTITEFYNAIAFARQGNIALSLEIGSAYAIQVAMLQIPALVAFSTYWRNYGTPPPPSQSNELLLQDTFTLVFPKWDVIAVLFGVFTVTYLYQEGKSNYFKGSMLLLAYGLLMCAFFYAPSELSMDS
ncbi:Sodium/calcium exchanger protein-domain-containing protein, partial [Chytriomyces sp. MP71]